MATKVWRNRGVCQRRVVFSGVGRSLLMVVVLVAVDCDDGIWL